MSDETLQCLNSEGPLLENLRAICPNCGFAVSVHLVDGVWMFVTHDWNGVSMNSHPGRDADVPFPARAPDTEWPTRRSRRNRDV